MNQNLSYQLAITNRIHTFDKQIQGDAHERMWNGVPTGMHISLSLTVDLGQKTLGASSSIFSYVEKHQLFFEPGA